MRSIAVVLPSILILVSLGCASAPLSIETLPVQQNEKIVGPAKGSSTGIMLFNFIPIVQNSRFRNAYQEALDSAGGTRLVDITIEERWFWAWVLNGYTFTVSGTAVNAAAN